MNAYEIADELDGRLDHKAANMLRQQADRIADLEKQLNTPKTYVLDGKQVFDTTPQIKELNDEEIKLIKGVVSDYVCTLKMEIDQQKQAFKGYEHCSNLDGLNNELKDSEQALAILKKASEK